MIKIYVNNKQEGELVNMRMENELFYNCNLSAADFEIIINPEISRSIDNIDELTGAALINDLFN